MPAGRPPIFETPEQMQRVIDLYFIAVEARVRDTPEKLEGLSDEDLEVVNDVIDFKGPTVSGLAYTLGMSTETLRAYGEKDQFSATVKRAKLRLENALEQGLYGNSVTGLIFNLKNNFGWRDKVETDHTSSDGSMSPPTKIELVARDNGTN